MKEQIDQFKNEGNPFESDSLKLTRPLSVPGSPRDRYANGLMTPGDLGTLQENNDTNYLTWNLNKDGEEEDITLRGTSVVPSDTE